MDKKNNNRINNAQLGNDSNLKNHNEKRKAQDSGKNDLKDIQKCNKTD